MNEGVIYSHLLICKVDPLFYFTPYMLKKNFWDFFRNYVYLCKMKFPKKIYPYLHELDEMEFSIPKKDSRSFRSEHKEELFKEYNHRMNLIEYRVIELGGNEGVHKIN